MRVQAVKEGRWGRYIPSLGIHLVLAADSTYNYNEEETFFYTVVNGQKELLFDEEEIEMAKPLYKETFYRVASVSNKPIVMLTGDNIPDIHHGRLILRIR